MLSSSHFYRIKSYLKIANLIPTTKFLKCRRCYFQLRQSCIVSTTSKRGVKILETHRTFDFNAQFLFQENENKRISSLKSGSALHENTS
ncbi:hypothetical protein RCL_jg20950.t1 [Rhizophagus clarus]|uniref:Uncharacterized protein n=1 Tax=Rhizophagus clarus TaxID=94130 RepID=A0A8H3LJJ4_9GLOM|nr:hypothetical protein RCL_jg20950.t1 [Rhizophagus clarus]